MYSPAAKRYFMRKACDAASVSHPNVISIHQFYEQQGLSFLVMPLLMVVLSIVLMASESRMKLAAGPAFGQVRDDSADVIFFSPNPSSLIVDLFGNGHPTSLNDVLLRYQEASQDSPHETNTRQKIAYSNRRRDFEVTNPGCFRLCIRGRRFGNQTSFFWRGAILSCDPQPNQNLPAGNQGFVDQRK